MALGAAIGTPAASIQFQVSQQSWETALAVGGIALLMVGIFGAAAAVNPR